MTSTTSAAATSRDTDPVKRMQKRVDAGLRKGVSPERIRRRLHMSPGELRDYCPEYVDDEPDQGQNGVTGY